MNYLHRYNKSFHQWVNSIDEEVRDSMTAPSAWGIVTVAVIICLLLTSVIPQTAHYFIIDLKIGLLSFLPTIMLGTLTGLLQKKGLLTASQFCILGVIVSALFQTFAWTLVALSITPGAYILIVIPVLLITYHAYMYRSSPKYPFITLGGIIALVIAFSFNSNPEHVLLYLVAGSAGILSSLVIGRNSFAEHKSKNQMKQMREAIYAQLLKEQSDNLHEVSQTLLKLQGNNHDAGNVLSTLIITLENTIAELAEKHENEEFKMLYNQLISTVNPLQELQQIILTSRSEATEQGVLTEPILLRHIITESTSDIKTQFPDVKIESNSNLPENKHFVLMSGGMVNLKRVLINILKNGCEGDGENGASHITILTSIDIKEKRVTLTITDDGPGLPDEFTKSSLPIFKTTKETGTGLGLYTSSQLLQASGGSLIIRNNSTDSGATAIVEVPLYE